MTDHAAFLSAICADPTQGMTLMKRTPFLLRVLQSVADAGRDGDYSSPGEIARRVFPRDHPGWKRIHKCGNYGSSTGGGLVLMMGGYLGKLKKAGLVESWWRNNHMAHFLTVAGQKILSEVKHDQ